jgi:enoyl-CoA hydratase/carnithine racemase
MATPSAPVRVERVGDAVARIVLDNPPLNVMTLEMTARLLDLLQDLAEDDSVRAVVVSASEDCRVFCAGSDIREFPQVQDDVIGKKLARENEMLDYLAVLPKPVVAALDGAAFGGGCELSLACDFRIIEEDVPIGLPEVKLGVFPGSGGVIRLPQLIGPGRALEMMMLGEPISAARAEAIGLVTRVVPPGQAIDAAVEMASALAKAPHAALAAIKEGVRASRYRSHEDAMQLSLRLSQHIFTTADFREGVDAFFSKRPPRFNAG